MKYFVTLHLLLLSAIVVQLLAQTPFFKNYTLPEIYSDATLNIVFEDRNSMLWFGTNEGLFSYDGIRFQLIDSRQDSVALAVRSVVQGPDSKLWVGCQNGNIYFKDGTDSLILWQPEEGLPKSAITGMHFSSEGTFWIATYGEGLYCYTQNRMYNINTDDGLLTNEIYHITSDTKNRIWVATDNGISICSFSGQKKQVENITKAEGLPDEIVKTILRDKEGNMWIGTYDQGVCYYDLSSKQFEFPLQNWTHGEINHLELFDKIELWIGTNGNGVFRYNLQEGILSNMQGKSTLHNAKIYDLHKDIEGNIWILSNHSQICSANRQFEFMEFEIESIQAILSDHQNNVWIGSQNGLYIYNPQSSSPPQRVVLSNSKPLNIISLYEDIYHHIWVGTFGQGVFVFDPFTKKSRHISEQHGLNNNSVLSIKGRKESIWLATLGGVTRITTSEQFLQSTLLNHRNYLEENGLGANFIYNIYIDSKDRIWFATDGKGITVLDQNGFANFQQAQGQPLKVVYSITEDHNGHIWFSTARQGIFEYFDGQFSHLSLPDGIRDLEIASLATNAKGDILILHQGGIDLLNPESRHLIYYDDEVGLKELSPNLNVTCKDQHGHIWLGDQKRIIKYTVLDEPLSIHPRTLIKNVAVFLDPVNPNDDNYFRHNQNHLSFEYIGLWYTDPATVLYRYKLDGYDLDWKRSKDRQASYSNLPPGAYRFMIQSTENEQFIHSEPIEYYAFTITSPIWQRWWFVVLSVIILGLVIWWMMRYRDEQLQKSANLKKEMIQSQFEALKSQINPHFLFNNFNTLITIIDENPKLAVQYVEQLADFYRSILQYREKDLITLKEEIELVENYSFLLKKRFGNNLKLDIRTNGTQAYVAPLTLQMLIENAVKHNTISSSKPLHITISSENDNYISIANNLQKKIGVTPQRSTGFGLQSIINRYDLLSDKKVRIDQSATRFKVSIPIIKKP